MYPTCYSRIPQCNAVVFSQRRRRSWISAITNIFNDGVSGFRLEVSTIYLGFNIEYLTFKINLIKTWTRKCKIQHQYNLQLSSWVPGLFHGHIKDGPRTGKWPPIHSYANCSVAHGNIQERFASAVCGQDTWPSPWRTGCRDLLLLLV